MKKQIRARRNYWKFTIRKTENFTDLIRLNTIYAMR